MRPLALAVFPFFVPLVAVHAAQTLPAGQSAAEYRGWRSLRLDNGLVALEIVPDIGGRVIQFRLGEKEFLWVNPALAGQMPPATGLAPDGSWLNYGGDKLWPAPQGWDNDEQWPGPPDAVLDGQPHRAEVLDDGAAVRLTSRDDPRSGIRFSRTIRPIPNRSGVRFEATMTNVDVKPRRWGIWAHTQLDAAEKNGTGHNARMRAYCPLNPQSKYPLGYRVIFGGENNPSFRTDRDRGLVCVDYRYQVGKIGVDSPGGWVEFWHNGVGTIHAYNEDMVMPSDPAQNPFVFESEILSPLARLAPGESYTWRYEWFATNIGGDFEVEGCNEAGVIVEPLRASRTAAGWRLTGRFGVFARCEPYVEWRDSQLKVLGKSPLRVPATPLEPLLVKETMVAPEGAHVAALIAGNEVDSVELR